MGTIRVCTLLLLSIFTFQTGRIDGVLQVEVPPEVITQELFIVRIGCNVTNYNGPVDYSWIKDDEVISTETPLVIGSVLVNQAGRYTCSVKTQETTPQYGSATTQLTVYYSPRWVPDAFQKFAGSLQEPISIICKTRANPKPDFFWSLNTINITSSVGRQIINDGLESRIQFSSVKQDDYQTYVCHAANDVGRSSFDIRLQPPGIPDGPLKCFMLNETHTGASLRCIPGFAGGTAELTFSVIETRPFYQPKDAQITVVWTSDRSYADIQVMDLWPNNNYTMLVHQENVHGRSALSYGVYVHTIDGERPVGPLRPGGLSMELIAIIAGVVGGVVLVVIVIIVVVCICRRSKPKTKSVERRNSVLERSKDAQSYVMEDSGNKSNISRENSQRFKRQPSWQAFKRKRPVGQGASNTAYQTDNFSNKSNSNQSLNRQIVDYNQHVPSSPVVPKAPYTISLGHMPGESSDSGGPGFSNPAYDMRNDISETSFNSDRSSAGLIIAPEVLLRRQQSNPMQRAYSQIHDQPGLAGHGALSGELSKMLANPNRGNRDSTLTNGDISLTYSDIKPPSFVPDVPWEYPRERLYIRQKLGEGSFGEVWRAKVDGILKREEIHVVAVKMLKDRSTPEERRALLKELDIMKKLSPHPNIIQLLGCCTKEEPICIIMEFAHNGCLQDILRKQRIAFEMNDLSKNSPEASKFRNVDLTYRDLTIFALHVASGMDYIASKELLHRDLAARNVLVDDQMVCKICDFGSSRDIEEMRQYESRTQRRLPLRWMAPESLFSCMYSVQSDVWAFGVLLWEIVTLGSSPYPGLSGPQVMEFVQKGCRMQKPKHCSEPMHSIMKDCWNQFPPRRPSFSILRHRLVALLDDADCNVFVDQMSDNAYDIINDLPGEKC